jgi:hypothetical protein
MLEVNRDQVLWLLTAHPDNWDLAEAPAWLSDECARLGFVKEVELGKWRKTGRGGQGYPVAAISIRLGIIAR